MSLSTNNGSAVADRRFRDHILDASLTVDLEDSFVTELLRAHFDCEPMDLALATHEHWARALHPLIQAGIDAYLGQPGRRHEVVGIDCPMSDPRVTISLQKLLAPASLTWPGVTRGQAKWERLQVGYERHLRCLTQGLIFVHDDERGPAAIWVSTQTWGSPTRYITIISPDPHRTMVISDELDRLGVENTPYAGEMFTHGFGDRKFLPRPEGISSSDVILPAEVFERIDQHAVGIARAADQLEAAGQHLKRGLLLYGPPGTGKTHTVRYLISQLPKETTIVAARAPVYGFERLVPQLGKSALIFLDDIDSTATDRSLPGQRGALFDLLEMMDGIQGLGNILFVMATNRLDVIEPAVAARPGRIDEVLEIPRPDATCRRRLFDRYRQGMELEMTEDEIEQLIERTEGVTASFTKELLRRATVIAVERGAGPGNERLVKVTAADVFDAVGEMLDPSSPITRQLLGADPELVVRTVAINTAGTQ